MTTKNKNIKYGNLDVKSPKDWDAKNIKIRITTFLDEDLLLKIKAEAKHQGKKYQSYLNERLREIFFDEESIEKRLKKLEKKVFKTG